MATSHMASTRGHLLYCCCKYYLSHKLWHRAANIINNYTLKHQLLSAFHRNLFVPDVKNNDAVVKNINYVLTELQSDLVTCSSDNWFGLRTKSDQFFQVTQCIVKFCRLVLLET